MEWNPILVPTRTPARAAVQYSVHMKAPRRRSRALASASAGTRTAGSASPQLRVPAGLRLAGRDLAFAIRRSTRRLGEAVTPLRATIAVAAVAAVAMAGSQLMDFGQVAVSSGDYAAYPGLDSVAQAPPVATDSFGAGHGLAMLALAVVALVAIAMVAVGQRRWAWAIVGAGLVAGAIALGFDLSDGLDESAAALRYEGAKASLTEGFWVEVVSAGVLALTGGLILLQTRKRGTR